MSGLAELKARWINEWPDALACWSKFTRLHDPVFVTDDKGAKREALTGSFAMIRLNDQTVVINLAEVEARGLQDFGREILAHEIGHHVYAPADLADHARMLARIRRGLPGVEAYAPQIANLFTDLLINDRLYRSDGLRLDEIYRRLRSPKPDRLWVFYMRLYELLWRLPKGDLGGQLPEDAARAPLQAGDLELPLPDQAQIEGDAVLGARLIRHYARDPVAGAGSFAALCLPYVLDQEAQRAEWLKALADLAQAGRGAPIPDGLAGEDDDSAPLHPSLDPALSDEAPPTAPPSDATSTGGAGGQARQPFEYGQILRALGLTLTDHELAVRYYRERARPHLIRFPARETPLAGEPLPEGLSSWELGMPLDDIDWFESVTVSPRVIPGLTTRQRVYGEEPGREKKRDTLDLDLYVDCSGSMPNPQISLSYLTLAGAIVSLSCLRAGGRVQATLWSGANQFQSTPGFVRDETAILRVLTGYLGGGTAFPLHVLRDTYAERDAHDRPAHILVISDDGVDTMYKTDEHGRDGHEIAGQALARARGGGTWALNLPYTRAYLQPTLERASAQGWSVAIVTTMEELVAFAREFSRMKFAGLGVTG
jgi:hypothetical protein